MPQKKEGLGAIFDHLTNKGFQTVKAWKYLEFFMD